MKLSRKQFIVFKRICRKYHIAIDSVNFNKLKVLERDANRKTRLRSELWKPKDPKSFRFVVKYNYLVHNKFWRNRNRIFRAAKRHRIYVALCALYNNRDEIDKEADTENWIKSTIGECERLEEENSLAEILAKPADVSTTMENLVEHSAEGEKMMEISDVGTAADFPEDPDDLFELIIEDESGMDQELDENDKENQEAESAIPAASFPEPNNNKNIVDSLLQKILQKSPNWADEKSNEPEEAEEKSPKKSNKEVHEVRIKEEKVDEPAVSFTKPTHPMQLPTPIVEKTRDNSAFLSEENDGEFKKIKKQDLKIVQAVGGVDVTKMMKKSEPPEFFQPQRPRNMERARTVAEKRLMLSSSDMRVRSMEQENKLFHQVRRKASNQPVDYELMDYFLVSNVPMRRSPWRALTWLRTIEGNYICKIIKIDGEELKIFGSVGNHQIKYIDRQTSRPLPKFTKVEKRPCCRPISISHRLKRSLIRNKSLQKLLIGEDILNPVPAKVDNTVSVQYKSQLERRLALVPAGPLSRKLKLLNHKDVPKKDEDDIFLGDFSMFKMPQIKLEVTLQPNKPVEPLVKRYLKEIIPHKDMTLDWLEFALSALKPSKKGDPKEKSLEKNVFEFDIPYENKNSIVVRKILKRSESADRGKEPPMKKAKIVDQQEVLRMHLVDSKKDTEKQDSKEETEKPKEEDAEKKESTKKSESSNKSKEKADKKDSKDEKTKESGSKEETKEIEEKDSKKEVEKSKAEKKESEKIPKDSGIPKSSEVSKTDQKEKPVEPSDGSSEKSTGPEKMEAPLDEKLESEKSEKPSTESKKPEITLENSKTSDKTSKIDEEKTKEAEKSGTEVEAVEIPKRGRGRKRKNFPLKPQTSEDSKDSEKSGPESKKLSEAPEKTESVKPEFEKRKGRKKKIKGTEPKPLESKKPVPKDPEPEIPLSKSKEPDSPRSSEDEMEWKFVESINKDDQVETEVAEVIKDLTNSTFINLNDDLFTKDEDNLKATTKTDKIQQKNEKTQGKEKSGPAAAPIVSPPKTKKRRMQSRVLLELRRLNANFVSAEDEHNVSNERVCHKEFCHKGCICDSLNPADDATSLTAQEMEHLRLKATSKLAKEEKDFRPTIILTDSDPLLVRNVENEGRRSKRAPKKYNDYFATDEVMETSTQKKKDTPSEVDPKYSNVVKKIAPISKFTITNIREEPRRRFGHDLRPSKKKFFVLGNIQEGKMERNRINESLPEIEAKMEIELKKMMHVNVSCRKIINLYDIEPYCMVHDCYKCVCNLKSTQGHPFEHSDFMNGEDVQKSKRKRSFEEKPKPMESASKKRKFSMDDPDYKDDFAEGGVQIKEAISLNPLQDDEQKASRCAPVNSKFYREKNRAEAENEHQEKKGILFRDLHGQRRIEIQNLNDLVNDEMGPIFINIYDCRLNRLNDVMRSLLINDNAIIYIDGVSYYLDKSCGIDVSRIKFDKIFNDIQHPIFVLQKKCDANMAVSGGDELPRDFVQLMHRENSVIVEKDKKRLKEVADIIDNVLQGARKKIEKKIAIGGNEHLREQLEKINRKRTSSCSSLSTASSPFYLANPAEQRLKRQLEDSSDTKIFNNVFTARMRKFVAILRSNTIGLRPSPEMINKFYLYRWDVLLKSYEQELTEIWLAYFEKDGVASTVMALSASKAPPPINFASSENIVNIRKMNPFDVGTPALAKLILLKIENEKTRNMVVLLYGCSEYFKVCGSMNSPVDYTDPTYVAKPCPAKNPQLSEKILKVYQFWKQFKSQMGFPESVAVNQERSAIDDTPKAGTSRDYQEPTEADIVPTFSPHPVKDSKFKYYLFKIVDDFSDIFIKAWNKYLSRHVIVKTITKAKKEGRIVKLTPANCAQFQRPRIYALPEHPFNKQLSGNYLVVGPYDNQESEDLILMQQSEGQLITREEFQKKFGLHRSNKTTASWIFSNTEMAFEMIKNCANANGMNKKVSKPVTSTVTSNSVDKKADDSMDLKISNIVGNYQEKSDDSNPDDGQCSSFESGASLPQLIIGEKRLNGDGDVKTLSQFRNQPWTSIQKNHVDLNLVKEEPASDSDEDY